MSCIQPHSRTPYLVSHALHMKHLADGEHMQSVQSRLSGMAGISSVECDPDAELVSVTYDLRTLHMEEIEAALHDMGMALKDDFFSHLRHAISHVMEELEDDDQSARLNKPDHAHNPFIYRKLAGEADSPDDGTA
ncbi:MAG: heavy-metal-associated domain-containing protein [Magnetococcales bacterium]|nr:heavy-metal-associated domain-containing protein [Magnetococcales bacterium]